MILNVEDLSCSHQRASSIFDCSNIDELLIHNRLKLAIGSLGSLRKSGGGDGHLFWIVLLVGVGLNSSGDTGRDSSCWELVLIPTFAVWVLWGLKVRCLNTALLGFLVSFLL